MFGWLWKIASEIRRKKWATELALGLFCLPPTLTPPSTTSTSSSAAHYKAGNQHHMLVTLQHPPAFYEGRQHLKPSPPHVFMGPRKQHRENGPCLLLSFLCFPFFNRRWGFFSIPPPLPLISVSPNLPPPKPFARSCMVLMDCMVRTRRRRCRSQMQRRCCRGGGCGKY